MDPTASPSPNKVSENLTREPQTGSVQTTQGSDTKTTVRQQGGTK